MVDDVVDPVATPLVDDVDRAAVVVSFPDVVPLARPLAELAVVRAVVVTEAEVVGRFAVVGRTVPLGRGRLEVAVVVGPVVGVPVVVGGVTALNSFTIDELQITVAPPPFPDPTHWLIVTGSAAVDVDDVTVHRTRRDPPPPLPELLHWVMAAPEVTPIGLQATVGWVPPPVPDWLHWLIEAGTAVPVPVMVLVMCTVQVTVPPPPPPEPLH